LVLLTALTSFLAECIRLLKPGGIFGATTPDKDPAYSMWMPDLRSAFASFPFNAIFPEDFPLQMHDQGHWADAAWVGSHLAEQGLVDVKTQVAKGHFSVRDADDFLETFGGMLAWVRNGWWDEETREAHSLEEVRELTKKHLIEKHAGKGWKVGWSVVCATGRVKK
jgi:SAM-dependent methyltransferase